MRARWLLGLALMLGITMFATTANAAPYSPAWPLIEQGDNLVRSGNPQAALSVYNQAYTVAEQSGDPYGMLHLAARYLNVRNEERAVASLEKACRFAEQWIRNNPNGGQMYTDGLIALQDVVHSYRSTVAALPASRETQQKMRVLVEAGAEGIINRERGRYIGNPPPGSLPNPKRPPAERGPNFDDLPRSR